MAKNKQKTRKIVTKRFKLTKTGKVKRKHSATTHLGRKNSADSANRKKKEVPVKGKFKKKIKSMLVKN